MMRLINHLSNNHYKYIESFLLTILIYILGKSLKTVMEKIKYKLEFPIQSSPSLLFQYISTPSGMAEWYADNVNSRGELYTFMWSDSEEEAMLLSSRPDERVKFRWLEDEDESYYFEMRIQVDGVTNDVSLIITDFAEEDELEANKMLWENMIANLKQTLGSR